MRNWLEKSKTYWQNKNFLLSFGLGLIFLLASFVIEFYAGIYATERASSPVTDIILSNIRVYSVTNFFIFGPYILWLFVIIIGILKPQKGPFVLKSVALFLVIRSVFITLTHIGPFMPINTFPQSDWLAKFSFAGDLFFQLATLASQSLGVSRYQLLCAKSTKGGFRIFQRGAVRYR